MIVAVRWVVAVVEMVVVVIVVLGVERSVGSFGGEIDGVVG